MTTYTITVGGSTKRSKFAPATVSVEFDKLPEASREFIIRYGLKQYLADGVAGVETQDEFNAGVTERTTKLEKGDLSRERKASAKVDDETGRTIKLVREMIRGKIKGANLKVEKEAFDAMVEKFLSDESKTAPFRAEAERQLAQEAKASAASADLLAELMG